VSYYAVLLYQGELAVTTQVKQLSSFISAPAGTDLSQLLEVLTENHIQILDPAKFAPGAVKITDKLIAGIRHADLVIAVLGTASLSGNVLFELGCASALGKKVLVIIPEGSEIPSDIKDLVSIRTTPNNREAVGFALEQILNSPAPTSDQKADLIDKSKPLGNVADDLTIRLKSLGLMPTDSDIFNIVQEALEASNIKAQSQLKQLEESLAFVVWIDELQPYFSNPITIEIKGSICTSEQANDAIRQVLSYMSINNITTVIVFAAQIAEEAMDVISSYPNLYFFDLAEILNKLRQESLGQIIRQERNSRVHGRIR
jgi:Nucleoside 2-deoxyribosyltransferase